jgi:predicted dehydrogenase
VSTPTRRSFFVGSALSVAGSVAAGYAANDAIRIGILGTGGRARHLMKSLPAIPGVAVESLCDCWDVALDEAKKLSPAGVFATKRMEELLARKSLDAVLIGLPDHWHAPATIAAVQAGKHVYVEKPLTHDRSEGDGLIRAVKASKKIVQVGTQQRSMPHIREAKTLIDAGQLGTIVKAKMSWNRNTNRVKRFPLGVKPEQVDWTAFLGNARKQPFDEYRFRNWRWFWDFGGGLFTDLMVHWIDVAHWLCNVDVPHKAVSVGDFSAAKDVWETPDSVQTLLQYPGNITMHYEGTFSNARSAARLEILGTDATLYIDRGRYELIPEKNKKVEKKELILGTGPPGADFYDKPDGELLHLQNWIDCIRTGKPPHSPVESGVASANAAHLANTALRGNGVANYN